MYMGDFATGKVVRIRFNTINTSGVPTTLTSGAVTISKDGADVTPSGGVTLTVDHGSVTGRHTLAVDTSVDTATFTASSEYAARLSGSSAVGSTSVVGIVVGEFSIQNRYSAAAGSAPTAAQVATAVWQDSVAGDFSVASSIGKFLTDAATTSDMVTAILTTPMAESYNTLGVPPTLSQALYAAMQRLNDFGISGSTITVNRLDGVTPAYTLTLDVPAASDNGSGRAT